MMAVHVSSVKTVDFSREKRGYSVASGGGGVNYVLFFIEAI